ncbi:hypothetical protein [Tenacibaculum discolor]|uniref:Por secretion system C-terminal sorting domain-containing protein n=1 Tax=Tenacibaculum discolor TaxID=361581 RepID=A0ABT9F5T9_9FLAO|nr:hypothetical protein [Tenacibaculum discolor]MDP2542092.1 hypothetical protein [Tenacibaculum discolor]
MKIKSLYIILLLFSMASFSQHTYLFKYKASFSSAVTSNALYFENTVTTNSKTTRISNLNKGVYSVKVRDSQKCLAKQ